MPDRHMPDAEASYRPLKAFVASRGGSRMRMHGPIRDRLVEMAVEEWPIGASDEHVEEVLQARLRRRVRERYGSVIAMFLISVLVNQLVRLIIEWWRNRNSHKVLMEGWARSAQANPDV